MDDFFAYMEQNRKRIREIVKSNTKVNEQGFTIITKDDPWRDEAEWDERLQKDSKK